VNKNKLPIQFSDAANPQKASVGAMSRVPAQSISFKSSNAVPDEEFKITALNPNRIDISVPVGLSHSVVEQRQKKMAERRRKAEKERKRLDAERRDRQARKEEEREEERRIRQELKRYVQKYCAHYEVV
jgi:Skp family chaperone for outer membrane proteins